MGPHWTSFPCTFCFPNEDNVAIYEKILFQSQTVLSHSYLKNQISRVSSHDL